MIITDADFVILSQTKVCHRASGATWAIYRYKNANEAGSDLSEHPGCAGEDNLPTVAELRPRAVALLRQLRRKAPDLPPSA
jgi:hypothetical protein